MIIFMISLFLCMYLIGCNYIHVNPERGFRGTNRGPSSEARRALEGGSGGSPPEIKKTCIAIGAM